MRAQQRSEEEAEEKRRKTEEEERQVKEAERQMILAAAKEMGLADVSPAEERPAGANPDAKPAEPERVKVAEFTLTPHKGRKNSGRTNQVKLRLTDEELARLQRRIKKAGIPQGEYLRNMALTGSIVVREEPPLNVELLDELALIRAELGRLGGLLKMIVRPNEGRRELSPKEWNELIAAIRWLEKVKKRMEEAERELGGHRNT